MTADRGGTTIVVPCYNEEQRLDGDRFLQLAQDGGVRLLFVNDGSTDETGALLARLAERSESISVLDLPRNVGKAESVRQGLLLAIERNASAVGYYDADLATPPDELLRLVDALQADPSLSVVFGSRVARLGSHIDRRPLRHYLGRIYATLASLALGMAVYDTQCGAKVFAVNPVLKEALEQPFRSSWSFDVLLCDRLRFGRGGLDGIPEEEFLEVPLTFWRDVHGSKLRVRDRFTAVLDVLVLMVVRLLRGGTPAKRRRVRGHPVERQLR
jgi:dolichyl-phosphate beta-glucosyltransferase